MALVSAKAKGARTSAHKSVFAVDSLAGRINLLIAFGLICVVGSVAYELRDYRASLWEQRRHELVSLASTATSIIEAEYAEARAGKKSDDEAKASAERRISQRRYGHGDYFWISDLAPRMVMHPINPALNGKDLSDFADPNGKRLFVAMADVVRRSGAGFVDYEWPKPGNDKPQPKLSYVVGFQPWGWVIGTGVYVDDLDKLFFARLEVVGGIMLGVIVLCGVVSLRIGRSITRAIHSMSRVMGRLAAGDLGITIEARWGARELDGMAEALIVFQRHERERLDLEAKAKVEREQSETLRSLAEREAIDSERRRVIGSFGLALAKLAGKDLSYRLEDEVPEAYSKLRDDFNGALDEIAIAMRNVRSSAEAIAAGAREIADASSDLAHRAERQSSTLEGSAAAVKELAVAVDRTAKSSSDAKDTISAAKSDAHSSIAVVERTIRAIGKIEGSSEKIGAIIGVIDEIAFQTNLLALNAGVEAARAGEAGRGFAVVASEVRGLAQRSAEAAKEIEDLIAQSSSEVSNGVEMVGETGRAFDRIKAQISIVDGGIADIASQAMDQSVTLKQVNMVVAEIDQVTQQNTAMAEQSMAACNSLAQESVRLQELVAQFVLAAEIDRDRAEGASASDSRHSWDRRANAS